MRRWLALTRFQRWAHFLLLPFAGVDTALPLTTSAAAMVRGVIISALVLSFGYLINSVSDREMDLDLSKNPLAEPSGDRDRFHLPLALCSGGALALSAAGPPAAMVAAASCLLCGWAYSVGPRLKSVPFVGTLMNAGNFAPLLFVGLSSGPAPRRLWWLLPAFAGMLLQNQLVHEAADAEEDRRGRIRTTFLVLGRRGAAALAVVCGLIVLGATLWMIAEIHAPSLVALHALPYVAIFPALIAREGDSPAQMVKIRRAQRWAAAASGALLVVLDL